LREETKREEAREKRLATFIRDVYNTREKRE